MATVTRSVGFCPVCQGTWKVHTGLLVHHGYRRPGTGEIHGDCFGVNRPPHELSPETAELYLRQVVVPELRAAERAVAHYGPPNEPAALDFDEWDQAARRHLPVSRRREDVPRHEWQRRLDIVRHNVLLRLESLQEETTRVEGLIATWAPQPLGTVEELERAEREAKSVQQRRVTADREQRSAHALVNLQQRVDRAVKKRDAGELTELFAGGWQKVVEPLGAAARLTRDDALRLVERDEVWAALGFMVGSDYINRRDVPSWLDMLHRKDIVWPEPRQVPRETVAQVKAERAAKKRAKEQAIVDSWRDQTAAEIDKAVRVRNMKALMNQFLGAALPWSLRKSTSERDQGRGEMLRLLARDDLWAALGWMHPDGTYFERPDFEEAIGAHYYDEDRFDPARVFQWPAGV